MSETIRLFVGCDGTNCDLESQVVLEYSIRKHASQPVEIVWMRQAASGPWSGWNCERGRTPFSGFRWSVPSACEYMGKALYCDSDFMFLADVAELWNQPIPGVALIRNPEDKIQRAACILFDCANAKGHVPPLKALKKIADPHDHCCQYFRLHRDLLGRFTGKWDCIDYEKDFESRLPWRPDTIKAYHYTRISSQFHLKHAIPRLKREGRSHWYTGAIRAHQRQELQDIFDGLLEEAIAAGYSVDQYRIEPFGGATRRAFTYASENKVAS